MVDMSNVPMSVILQFSIPLSGDGWDRAVALLNAARKIGVEEVSHTTVPAKAAAPKTNSKKAPAKTAAPAPKEDVMVDLPDVSGGDEDDEETGGLGLADDSSADITPAEAKEEALDRLRKLLANGHKAEVKTVQQLMRVAKFHDVPEAQGHAFLKAVQDIESKIAG